MGALKREMNKDYWDGMAGAYEDEIFSVIHSDRNGLIKDRLSCIASRKGTVADVGCGIGHFLSLLSDRFGHVYANDIAPELLKRAYKDHGHKPNITFWPGDITSVAGKLPKVNCVVSVNSLISSSIGIRMKMLKAISGCLKPGGHLVLVVPSLESSLFVDVQFARWKWKDGMKPAAALRSVYPKDPAADHLARQGILSIDGVPTKHYLKEELRILLADAALDVMECAKVEYEWKTELENTPSWMKDPYPWDWLVVARRRAKR